MNTLERAADYIDDENAQGATNQLDVAIRQPGAFLNRVDAGGNGNQSDIPQPLRQRLTQQAGSATGNIAAARQAAI